MRPTHEVVGGRRLSGIVTRDQTNETFVARRAWRFRDGPANAFLQLSTSSLSACVREQRPMHVFRE